MQIFPIAGPEPESLLQVMSRQKDIAFASRADSHIPRQEHIHQLRHMVRELVRMMPEAQRETPEVKEIAGYGCGTLMHIIRLNAAPLEHEDYLRDIDFSPDAIRQRWQAGYNDTARTLARKPWEVPIDPIMGVAVFDSDGAFATSSVEKGELRHGQDKRNHCGPSRRFCWRSAERKDTSRGPWQVEKPRQVERTAWHPQRPAERPYTATLTAGKARRRKPARRKSRTAHCKRHGAMRPAPGPAALTRESHARSIWKAASSSWKDPKRIAASPKLLGGRKLPAQGRAFTVRRCRC